VPPGAKEVTAEPPAAFRLVALGASNLTRGLHAVVSTARNLWGRDVEIVAALGVGRSYGLQSRVLVRSLPSILHSGLWAELKRRPPVRTRGLITDVGNDILYGASPEQILAWVAECLDRLTEHTADVTVTGLPLHSIERLSRAKYLMFRSILFARCRLSHAEVLRAARHVADGLAALAEKRGVRFFRLESDWYGFDPIHLRPGLGRSAWQEILGAGATPAGNGRTSLGEIARLYTLAPERQWLFGLPQDRPQQGIALRNGGRIWLY
jgi:hypothetical protein